MHALSLGGPSRSPPPPAREDVTEELRRACRTLPTGQLAHIDGFVLFDTLPAIELLDARMDSGVLAVPPHMLAACDRLSIEEAAQTPAFDPAARLSIQDVCWLMDRTLAAEVAWHLGAPLSASVHTCLYIHEILGVVNGGSGASSSDDLLEHVLQPYLIALLKSVSLAWDELVGGNIIDGEDFCGDKAGISLCEGLTVASALRGLDAAMAWVQQADASIRQKDAAALLKRLELRKHLLSTFSLLALANTGRNLRAAQMLNRLSVGAYTSENALSDLRETLSQLQGVLDALSSDGDAVGTCLLDPALARAPSPIARAAFDVHFARRLAASGQGDPGMPPPRAVELPEPSKIVEFLRSLADGVEKACDMIHGAQWSLWRGIFVSRAVTFQHRPECAFIRSLLQSVCCSFSQVAFGRFALPFLPASLLETVGAISLRSVASQIAKLAAASDESRPGPRAPPLPPHTPLGAHLALESFMQRLAGQIVSYLTCFAQNRARGKRKLAGAYAEWVKLAEEAQDLGRHLSRLLPSGTLHPDAIFACVQHVILDIMLHITMSGIELELYAPHELVYVHWMAASIANEQGSVLKSLSDDVKSRRHAAGADDARAPYDAALAYLRREMQQAQAVGEASVATMLLHLTLTPTRQRPWPLVACPADDATLLPGPAAPSVADATATSEAQEAMSWACFARRFKWLGVRGRPASGEQITMLYEDWAREMAAWDARDDVELLSTASRSLASARSAAVSLRDEKNVDDEVARQIAAGLADVLSANASLLAEVLETSEPPTQGQWSWQSGEHPWFARLSKAAPP